VPVGGLATGCQELVKEGDEVLFAFANPDVKHYLKLTGPISVNLFRPAKLVVTDGNGAPVKGADVNGELTDGEGKVSITFKAMGTERLKAEKKPDSIRSNELVIEVIPPILAARL
jgi:hypothetical protein